MKLRGKSYFVAFKIQGHFEYDTHTFLIRGSSTTFCKITSFLRRSDTNSCCGLSQNQGRAKIDDDPFTECRNPDKILKSTGMKKKSNKLIAPMDLDQN